MPRPAAHVRARRAAAGERCGHRGDAAHELLEVALLALHRYWRASVLDFDLFSAPDIQMKLLALPLDEQKSARDGVTVALNYVRDILDDHPDAVLLVEQHVRVPCESAPGGSIPSTLDVLLYLPSWRQLTLLDYKHGAGVYVPVLGNMQVRGYAFAALSEHPEWDVDSVVLAICSRGTTWPAASRR